MSWLKRERRDRRPAADVGSRLAALAVAVDEAVGGDWHAQERLVDVLADVDDAGDEALARAALAVVVTS